MNTEIISDAEIAGYMNWRGPGAYTQNSLRKIKRIIEEVQRRMTEQPVSKEPVVQSERLTNDEIQMLWVNWDANRTSEWYECIEDLIHVVEDYIIQKQTEMVQPVSQEPDRNTNILRQLQYANDAISTALQALGPVAPDCCGCATEWQVAIDALTESHRHDGIPKGFRPHSERMAELRQDPKKAAALNRAKERLAASGKPMADHIADPGKLVENHFGEHTDMAERIADIVLDDHVELMRENERLRRDLDAKDAQIDRLMWEYCPQEMSMEQVDNWMKHQEAVSVLTLDDVLNAAAPVPVAQAMGAQGDQR